MSKTLATFEDSRAIAEPAGRIREEHRLALQCRDSAVAHAIEAGRLLLQAQTRLGRGEFFPWVEAHCGIARSTACRYITAWKQSSTGAPVSSLRSVFPSGRLPGPKGQKANMQLAGSQAQDPESQEEIPASARTEPGQSSTAVDTSALCDSPLQAATSEPDDGPPYPDEDGEPSEAEIAELDEMIASGEATEIAGETERAADFYLGGAVPKPPITNVERLQQMVMVLEQSRNGFMNGKAEIVRLLKAEQRKTARLERELAAANTKIEQLETENESLRERVAIIEETT